MSQHTPLGLPWPSQDGSGLWETARTAVAARSRRRRRYRGAGPVCPAAAEPRSYPGRWGASGPAKPAPQAPTGPHRLGDALPERGDEGDLARGTVTSRATGPADLAALLDMLDLRSKRDG
ncbi:hypothetical protein [Streptomyces sp. CB00455]|uniref:hypothetical protein n=1 Tax=Streptomyces sp. CB00455 TaxID=1703927 RepID=UPI00116128EA|nr:hypothetical protein [Streptomyces sp. CB00455]